MLPLNLSLALTCPVCRPQLMYEKILTAELRFPRHFAPETRSLLAGMLTRRVEDRLGFRGAAEIKAHPFFNGLNWDTVQTRGYKPIFTPPVNGIDGAVTAEGDADYGRASGARAGGDAAVAVVSNFEDEFTKETPVDSMDERSKLSSTAAERTHFEGFTYMGDGGALGATDRDDRGAASGYYNRASRGESFSEQPGTGGAGSPAATGAGFPRPGPGSGNVRASPGVSRVPSGREHKFSG
jgi:hypothetical protein